ncbi:MAG: glycerol-3-phosphate dehydrogenase, partial [Variibacter sp.]|jgi:glycerol-3-phosphate dehydrogenase|nr:glycerol-3-phosphate dehydrogenase [Variibacter sp.]
VPALVAEVRRRWPFLSETHAKRLVRSHGTRAAVVLGKQPGDIVGDSITEAELRYFIREEWARTPDDVLWRRSKLGLHLSETDRATVARLLRQEEGATTG